MARTDIAVVAIGKDTVEPAPTVLPAEGGQFPPAPRAILKLTNTGTVTRTARLLSVFPDRQDDPSTIGVNEAYQWSRGIPLAAGATHYVRFDTSRVIQPDGLVHVDVDAATDVKALVLCPLKADLS
ncbi:hypothetical protein [Actinacidiphila rubida]|uniref:Uncharacterized protein n=1 Tax=Actinacidiphila rubida TaxID=310780 RepID=A0A1H8PLR7_9ACTN|nr:hypothetical protein [Actinacidiphila rubida]SEO42658.1 hypothetical protein SAMN05216267_102629 [Actinacidiphila rubida]